MNGLNSRAAEVMMELVAALESATRVPEQGEASAAIERVRAIIKPHIGWQLRRAAKFGRTKPDCGCEQCQILAALDGAPEPEWEVQYGRRNRETGALHWLTGDPRDDWWHENQDRYEHVKRYTSPPLPVEGES